MIDHEATPRIGRAQAFWCLVVTVLGYGGIAAIGLLTSPRRALGSLLWLVVVGVLAARVWRGSNGARIALAIIVIPSGVLFAKGVQSPLSARPEHLALTALGLIPSLAMVWLSVADGPRAFLSEQRRRAGHQPSNAT